MNKSAVALAADSAVTTGLPGREKIFTGANKIFTLSKFHPVGIMINGHVEHCGIPFEVLIKEYRRQLGRKRYDLIKDYSEDFYSWGSRADFVNENAEAITVIAAALATYSELVRRARNARAKLTVAVTNQILAEMEQEVLRFPVYADFQDLSQRRFNSLHRDKIDAVILSDEYCPIPVPKTSMSTFRHVVYIAIIHEFPSAFETGLIISGFGEKELFPSLEEFFFDGVLCGKVRRRLAKSIDIERSKETVFVSAFAQEDATKAFLYGVDDAHLTYIFRYLPEILRGYTNEILDQHTSYDAATKRTIVRMLRTSISNVLSDLRETINEFSYRNFFEPVQSVLRNAPKDELAAVAEAFINITSLKRKVSSERETVAGPVDVAVISRGDGFVWIKRKHYFPADLNHQFMYNYFHVQ
ncbi:MAG: hypothetical protein KDA64_03475 [Rhodospirillaceae bacterium]|nr:hypothetical protein [Rhodospirillaceae bacterium]